MNVDFKFPSTLKFIPQKPNIL